MKRVMLIRFKRTFKAQYVEIPEGAGISSEIEMGIFCIVEHDRGQECGSVAGVPRVAPDSEFRHALPVAVRLATEEDRSRDRRNASTEEQAHALCEERIQKKRLPARLVKTESSFDGTRIFFYFTSESRLEVRELSKEVNELLIERSLGSPSLKVEFKQVGARDQAAMVGGCGPCGRPLCCSTFLVDYPPVSVRKAKEQHVPMNPFKLNGICGRLKCCIAYEWGVGEKPSGNAAA